MTLHKAIIYLEPNSELSLQNQIRQKLVEAIQLGTFPLNKRLPSSRKLADQLGVARNTVVLAYQQLLDEGYLISRERSGIYVNQKVLAGKVGLHKQSEKQGHKNSVWLKRFKGKLANAQPFSCPQNWQQYPYPFIDGHFDTSLYPIQEWRKASRLALGAKEIYEWAGETGDTDDPMLIEQIRSKILPRRGIQADQNEILITVGTTQALFLVTQLLVTKGGQVGMEEPGYPEARQLFLRQGADLTYQALDREGLIINDNLNSCRIIYVTPSHQTPTAVTMSLARRQALLAKAAAYDQVVIEDDYEFESNYLGHPHPALRSIDKENRVIYMSCLSKVLQPGLRLGFMVAAPEVIEQARKLRHLMVLHPPLNNQRTAAYFLALGHYDTFLMHLYDTFQQRWIALRRAVNYYLLHDLIITPSQGGTSLWIHVPPDLAVKDLVRAAAEHGILIEPMDHYYATPNAAANCFRMGVTSIPHDRIRAGVIQLRNLLHDLRRDKIETFANALGQQLQGEELFSAMANHVMLCLIAYGDPCTIKLLEDGSMIGEAGYEKEDCDTGTWWVEGEFYYRQWSRWAWGEVGRYRVKADGINIKLFDEEGRLIENAQLERCSS